MYKKWLWCIKQYILYINVRGIVVCKGARWEMVDQRGKP